MSLVLHSSFFTNTLSLPNKLIHSHRRSHSCTNKGILGCQNGKNMCAYSNISTSIPMQPSKFGDMEVVVQKDMPMATPTGAATATTTPSTGIGIVNFFGGKNFLVTGATGFLAKVFVEKILRTTPDVGRIFLLIKAKDKDDAMKRVKSEIVESELFKCLADIHGKSYQKFMLSKLVPVVGNICESHLGMDFDSANEISKEVDVIVNSAADTTMDQRYDMALEVNTRGPCRLMSFAQKCKKVKVFMHFSTAFVNGERKGLIAEKPFSVGESITRERLIAENSSASFPQLDIDAEIEMASQAFEANVEAQKLKDLGLVRARFFGWHNTYSFTKAMGEMLISNTRRDIPVVIVRPSIIKSTYEQPFPGWIQGNRVLDPMIMSYGKGNLPGYFGDPQAHMDVVPVDMVVNASLAAIAKHGIEGKSGTIVYHTTSAVVNPLLLCDLFKFACEHFVSSPFTDGQGKKVSVDAMKFFSSMDEYSAFISAKTARKDGASNVDKKVSHKLEMKRKRKVEYAIRLAKIYEPFMFDNGWFHNGNTQKLMEDMSKEEMEDFGIDFGSINWRNYILNVHIPGVKKHVLKGRTMIA